jgi:DNA-binding transcriptional LysR family regulator
MDLRQVEIFYYVAKHRSFSKAAAALSLTQPTVSGHIKALETALNLILFDRLGRDVQLTYAGDILYSHAKRLIDTKQAALQGIEELRDGLRGELTLGGSSIPGQYVLPRILGQFQPQYPGITIVLHITDTMETLECVVRGDFELGIVGAQVPHPHVAYYPFVEDELVLAVAADHPWAELSSVPIDVLTTVPFIQRERGSGSRLVVERALADAGLPSGHLQVVAEMGTTEAIKQGIKAGLGVSIMSVLALTDERKAGSIRTVTIDGLSIHRHFSMIRHTGRSLSPLAQTFEAFLHTLVPLSLTSQDSQSHVSTA